MNSEKPMFTPFKQIPEWDPNETFTLTGKQLQAVQEMFKAYTPFVQALESVFTGGLDSGKITIRYEDTNGNPLTKDEIEAMLKRYAEDMSQAMRKLPAEPQSAE